MDKDKKHKKGGKQAKRNLKTEDSGSEEIEEFNEPASPKPANRNKKSAFALLADEDNESVGKSDDSDSEKEEPSKANGKKAPVPAAVNQNQKKNKKAAKGGKKGATDNFDEILEEFSGKPAVPAEEKKNKKKKKGSNDVDKIFEELEIPVASSEQPVQQQRQLPSQLEIRSDMTAEELAKIVEMMAMEDDENEDDKKKKKKNKKQQQQPQQKQQPKEAKEGSDDESGDEDGDEGGEGSTVKTAAQKKKEKKERQKQEKQQTKLKVKEKKDATAAPVSAQEKEEPATKADSSKKAEPSNKAEPTKKAEPAKKAEPQATQKPAAVTTAKPVAAPKPAAEPPAATAKPEAAVAELPAAAPVEEEAASGKSKKDKDKDKKKKKGESAKEDDKSKKPSKLVNKILETQRLLKEEEERLKREEEERIRKEEEEIRLQEEKERLEKERKERKKQKEKEREKRLKAEGKWLSKEEREDKKKIKQLIEFRKAQGLPVPGAKTPGDLAPPDSTAATPVDKPKRVVYASKPKKKPQQPAAVVTPTEQKDVDTEVAEAHDVVEPPPAEVKVEEEPEDVKDNWDDESESEAEASPVLEKPKAEPAKPAAAAHAKQAVIHHAKAISSSTKSVAAPKAAAVPHKAHAAATRSAVKSQTSKEESSDDESEDDSSSSESSSDSEEEADAMTARDKALERMLKRKEEAEAAKSLDHLRAPVVCVLGHVDTGKTKILDKLRRTHVQDGEAGGITQQIGATNVPQDALKEQTKMCKDLEIRLPGLLIIDTPGHESFSNLRTRGSSLCDIAILVVDVMHGLEKQTKESINILKQRKTPFVVALNKIDRLIGWATNPRSDIQDLIKKQTINTILAFEDRVRQVIAEFAEQSLNACLSYENKNPREYISLVPTSATSGDGIGNLLALICTLTQNMLAKRLMFSEELQATVMEVKAISGLGTTIDVILVNGRLTVGSTIVVAGQEGPIVTQVRSLLVPQPMQELRVKGQYAQPKEVVAAQGCKIAAKDLEKALAGLPLHVAHNDEEVEIYKEEMAQMVKDVLGSFNVSEKGVYVQASTLGSLEALLTFLTDSKIPYSGINIGPVHKRDIMRTSVMLEHDPLYACILAFDVKIEREAQEMADKDGIRIFSANIIYHLQDEFTKFREDYFKKKKEEFKHIAVYPCKLRILKDCVFKTRDPIICGVVIEAGSLRVGTVLCIPSKNFINIGRVISIEVNNKPMETGATGKEVCIKIEPMPGEAPKLYDRHFDYTDLLVSRISRESIDAVKNWFRDDMTKEDWKLMVELKHQLKID